MITGIEKAAGAMDFMDPSKPLDFSAPRRPPLAPKPVPVTVSSAAVNTRPANSQSTAKLNYPVLGQSAGQANQELPAIRSGVTTLREQASPFYANAPGGYDAAVRFADFNKQRHVNMGYDTGQITSPTTQAQAADVPVRVKTRPHLSKFLNYGTAGGTFNPEKNLAYMPKGSRDYEALRHEVTHAANIGATPGVNDPILGGRFVLPRDEARYENMVGGGDYSKVPGAGKATAAGKYFASPHELDPRLADIKRQWVASTGRQMLTEEDANDALRSYLRDPATGSDRNAPAVGGTEYTGNYTEEYDQDIQPDRDKYNEYLMRRMLELTQNQRSGIGGIAKAAAVALMPPTPKALLKRSDDNGVMGTLGDIYRGSRDRISELREISNRESALNKNLGFSRWVGDKALKRFEQSAKETPRATHGQIRELIDKRNAGIPAESKDVWQSLYPMSKRNVIKSPNSAALSYLLDKITPTSMQASYNPYRRNIMLLGSKVTPHILEHELGHSLDPDITDDIEARTRKPTLLGPSTEELNKFLLMNDPQRQAVLDKMRGMENINKTLGGAGILPAAALGLTQGITSQTPWIRPELRANMLASQKINPQHGIFDAGLGSYLSSVLPFVEAPVRESPSGYLLGKAFDRLAGNQ